STVDGPSNELSYDSGFWFYDDVLIAKGKPLTVDDHFFYRNGEVFPVTGATYMASDVHRRFLFDPNPLVWDRDFRQMKQAGVNMVRTGIWTGWKKYMPAVGKVDEGVLRAFDAFLLTAHLHDIPVIFTFFAFLPETWGGLNAYLDARAVKAQQEFISAFTKRYPRVDDVMWDFINEPSFCSPKYLWNCRPNYDEHEKAAWKQWLKDRYPARNEEELVSHLQQLWRTTNADPFDLPQLKDFDSVHLIDDRQPLKTLDYRLFAQDMFIRWTRQMTEAVRSNGNPKQLITVGQDEAGLGDSPNIQFFAKEIDFTSLHNWWANDDLVWDSVLAKAPSKLSLMEETGVMFYEKADATRPWRSEQDVSNLLERKMALSIGADGAGFIEWVWNTNPYMNSTNEVGIGFHRVDGTAKPELQPFLAIAKFMGQHGRLLRERQAEPVVMVIPHSQMFSPRSFAHEATRRCVRAMYYHCGVPLQAVSEYTIADYSLNAKLIIVPSPFVLTRKCWDALLTAARNGAVVAISGVIDADDHALPVERSKLFGVTAQIEPVSQSEAVTIGSQVYTIRYEGEKMQRIEKSVFPNSRPLVQTHGTGKLIWCPLPLEVGDSMTALSAFYNLALNQAQVRRIFNASPHSPAVLVLPSVFRDVVLYTFVSEIDRDTTMEVIHLETKSSFPVTVRGDRTAMVLLDRKNGKILARL
ncbi:MAG TPA: beta-galactosidase, partial [Pyrinomonadaceae bacterium]|nr:beta-galactosidase [Pyrinomonadaceae bacterium]